jgi:hypothetical protein
MANNNPSSDPEKRGGKGEVTLSASCEGLSGSEALESLVEDGGLDLGKFDAVYSEGRRVGSSVSFSQWNSPWIPEIDRDK